MDNNENKGELLGFDQQNGSEKENFYEPTAAEILEETILKEEDEEIEEEIKPQFLPTGNYGEGASNNYVPKKQKNKPEKRFTLSALIAAILIAAIVGSVMGIGGFITADFLKNSASDNEPTSSLSQSGTNENKVDINVQNVDATIVEAVAKKVTPSVVGIRTTVSVNSFFGGTSESSGEGSGVVYTSDGYIITNYHVIAEAIEYSGSSPEVSVFLENGNEDGYKATVVGYNISHDLAVIKIDAKGLTPVTFADLSLWAL